MAQRLRPGSLGGMATLHQACRPVLSKPEEQRSRPRGTGNLSRDRRQRAVVRALPGEAVIEDHDFVGSTLPLAYQPGSGLQLRCDLAQLALWLWAETAQSNLLHSVCDRSDQQLAAEM